MNTLVSTWLFVMASYSVVLGASLKSSDLHAPFHLLNRQVRNAPDLAMFEPCLRIHDLTGMKRRFNAWLDMNDDGKASTEETKSFLKRFKDNIKDDTVTAFIARRDSNENGVIDFVPEYIESIHNNDNTMEGAREWFAIQDSDDDGIITAEELFHQSQNLGMSAEEARETVLGYYLSVDANNDKKLDFDEFKRLYV